MRRRRTISLVGVAVLALGTWLPWLRFRAGREAYPLAHLAGMGSGLEYYGIPLLVCAVLVALGLLARPDSQFTTVVAAVTGCAGSLAAGVELSSLLGSDYYMPTAGLYLTAVGSILLVVSSGSRALVTSDGREPQ